jgi:predicted nucleic acid-binding protein
MIVVSDTTPIHYLVLIGETELLPALFQTVLIPPSVASELLHQRAPEIVRRFMATPPAWLQIRLPQSVLGSLSSLGSGEREAISLSLETHAELMLTDDQEARRAAESLGVVVTGTLGLIRSGGKRQLINVQGAIGKLQATSMRLPADAVRDLLAEFTDG